MSNPMLTSALRKHLPAIASSLLVLFLAGTCASTKTTTRERRVGEDEKLPRPDDILVYDFIATPSDVPPDSMLANQYSPPISTQTAEEAAVGRQLGEQIAAQLVEGSGNWGLSALWVPKDTKPRLNDIVIRGYLLSIEEGDATKRVVIGFGAGASELQTVVEGFQMTPTGLRRLGFGTVNSVGNKTPGAALGVVGWIATVNPVGLAVSGGTKLYGEATGSSKIEGRAKATAEEILKQLKARFQQQGWIIDKQSAAVGTYPATLTVGRAGRRVDSI
jgi:hypothetical protein